MDSITQAALGAAVGEAVLGRKVGNRAPLWGAICGTIPDLDVLGILFLNNVAQQAELHRGFSHSILFAIIAAPLVGWIISRIYKQGPGWKPWSLLTFWCVVTHPILDAFTTYGTQLFWPLQDRVAWNTIFVMDPVYTVPLLLTVIILLFFTRTSESRRRLNKAGLILSSAYLAFTLVNKQVINNTFESALKAQGIEYQDYITRPMPFNNLLWSGLVKSDNGFRIGYYSLLDANENIEFHHFPANHELFGGIADHEDVVTLKRLSQGYYTLTAKDELLVFNDLRFGLGTGWLQGKPSFVAKYILIQNQEGLEVQRDWRGLEDASQILSEIWNRILGK
ncbi:MAG: metal-dependent hydrolase [Bacteroidetes bacterium]|nr:metal-dependent hydrolase [Bacteroidota bacterium]